MNATDLIDASSLFVSIGGMPILRDVSVRVAKGEVVALIGGNGSGKSTLVRTLLGLQPFQEGSIQLFGTPLAKFRRWSRIGYVPQRSTITITNATVREVAASGRLAHRHPFQWLGRADRAVLDHALTQVGLSDRARWPFNALSGGQKQRVLIARALASEPELLVMDEPMVGVDLHSQQELADLLAGFRDEGLGLLVVLHERGPMAPVIDRAVTMCDGRVVSNDHPIADNGLDVAMPDASIGLTDPLSGTHS